jgi:hypothetical protein
MFQDDLPKHKLGIQDTRTPRKKVKQEEEL